MLLVEKELAVLSKFYSADRGKAHLTQVESYRRC